MSQVFSRTWTVKDDYGRSFFASTLRRTSRCDAVERLLRGHEQAATELRWRPTRPRARSLVQLQERQLDQVGPKAFEILSVLGRGSFGEVFQVAQKSTGQIFAMKVLRKNKRLGTERETHVEIEWTWMKRGAARAVGCLGMEFHGRSSSFPGPRPCVFRIIGRNLMRYALTERNLLSYIRHPFIAPRSSIIKWI